jgi:translocation protein SEC62
MSSSNSKKNKKQLKDMEDGEGGVAELTKEETQIARFLRLNCPNKQGNLVGMKVNFFIANKLVDCLMESKWGPNNQAAASSKNSNKQQTLFSNRQACVSFMQRLMNKQLFYRVVKVYKESSTSTNNNNNKEGSTDSNTTPSNLRKRKAVKEADNNDTPNTNTPSNKEKDTSQAAVAKRKFKLEMHETQTFVDANEPYVWIYDPTSTTTYIIGFLLILGSIGICLFPLWPSQVREGVYYLSLAGISVLGAILGLAAFKYVLFAFLWLVTLGKLHFWLFPNLTEDVGFLESFVPVYKIESPKQNSQKEKQKKSETNENEKIAINENDETEKTAKDLTTSIIKTPNTPSAIKASIYELSKSTVEVNTTGSDSPLLLTKSTRKQNDEEDFELVGDDDLVKQDQE